MESFLMSFVDLVLHLDKHLPEIMAAYGSFIYAILFAVVFCETGLVVTPFLPGDSLLFACGALAAAAPEGMDIKIVTVIFLVAAILGDASNYMIGEHLGEKLISMNTSLIKKEHIDKAHAFYEKHGPSVQRVNRPEQADYSCFIWSAGFRCFNFEGMATKKGHPF